MTKMPTLMMDQDGGGGCRVIVDALQLHYFTLTALGGNSCFRIAAYIEHCCILMATAMRLIKTIPPQLRVFQVDNGMSVIALQMLLK